MALESEVQRREEGDSEIHSVSSWVLRGGVIASVAVMLAGMAISLASGHPSLNEIENRGFSGNLPGILRGSLHGDGASVIELGILLLVVTPILRVASSVVIFATHERDWLYTFVTLFVLTLTLLSLFLLR